MHGTWHVLQLHKLGSKQRKPQTVCATATEQQAQLATNMHCAAKSLHSAGAKPTEWAVFETVWAMEHHTSKHSVSPNKSGHTLLPMVAAYSQRTAALRLE
jgi:hypothetical protein